MLIKALEKKIFLKKWKEKNGKTNLFWDKRGLKGVDKSYEEEVKDRSSAYLN